jgi:Transglutaminase-like superfamily
MTSPFAERSHNPQTTLVSDMTPLETIVADANQQAKNRRQLAIVLHDHVRDHVKFGFTPYFDAADPLRTLQIGVGHCNPQARLMVALFRAAGFAARFRPVTINNEVLRRAVQTPPLLSHVFTEVQMKKRWVRLDSYIVDTPLRVAAVAKLRQQGWQLGYGCHASATGEWDGESDSFSQVATPDMVLELHSPVDDIEAFYRSSAYKHRLGPVSFSTLMAPSRLLPSTFAKALNTRLEKLRASVVM